MGGGGALCPLSKLCRCKNSGKIRAKFGLHYYFVVFCLSIILTGSICRIACTPKPILEYRTDFGRAGKTKKCTSPLPPPPLPLSEVSGLAGIRSWIHDSGQTGQTVCPPQKKKKKKNTKHTKKQKQKTTTTTKKKKRTGLTRL